MTWLNFTDESRRNYGTTNRALTQEQIRTGCLQRIADATEKMAQRHTELIKSRDYYESMCKLEREAKESARRSNAALRGQITKLRKRLAAAEGGAK